MITFQQIQMLVRKRNQSLKVNTKNKQTVEKTDPQKLAAQRKAYNELTDAIRNYSNITKESQMKTHLKVIMKKLFG